MESTILPALNRYPQIYFQIASQRRRPTYSVHSRSPTGTFPSIIPQICPAEKPSQPISNLTNCSSSHKNPRHLFNITNQKLLLPSRLRPSGNNGLWRHCWTFTFGTSFSIAPAQGKTSNSRRFHRYHYWYSKRSWRGRPPYPDSNAKWCPQHPGSSNESLLPSSQVLYLQKKQQWPNPQHIIISIISI